MWWGGGAVKCAIEGKCAEGERGEMRGRRRRRRRRILGVFTTDLVGRMRECDFVGYMYP